MSFAIRRRSAGFLLLGGAIGVTLLMAIAMPGVTAWSAPAGDSATQTIAVQTCTPHYYALGSGKTMPDNFGPPITQQGISGAEAELRQRRSCDQGVSHPTGDPALLTAEYQRWAEVGLTKYPVAGDTASTSAFTASLVADYPKWQAVAKELSSLEDSSAKSTEVIPAGSWTEYMVPNGSGGVEIRQGITLTDATAIVYNLGATTIKYLLNCGGQPAMAGPAIGFVMVPETAPEYPQCAPQLGTWPNCYTPPSVVPPTCTDCTPPPSGKDWSLNVTPPTYVTPQGNDAYEPPPAAPVDPAPVQSGDSTPTSTSTAPEATSGDSNPPALPAGTGTTPDGGTGGVNPGGGSTGSNDSDPGLPAGF